MITPAGTFRELTDTEPDGIYDLVRPADDKRRFEKTTGGWEITELDGTVHAFNADGRWASATDRFGTATTGGYTGDDLTEIAFPDGRTVELTYHTTGKLARMTEVGTDSTTERIWSYTWAGDNLSRIDRPDGTAWTFQYTEPNVPFMTRQTLVGVGGSGNRIEAEWDYDDTTGFLIDVWKGSANKTDGAATDRYSFDRSVAGETTVTDPLGSETVWTWDEIGGKPRVLDRSGDCPSCGGPAEVSYSYDDAANPLQPTAMADPNGTVTSWTYDSDTGMPLSRTEADGVVGLERTTNWEYHPTYPALPNFVSRPPADAGCTAADGRSTTFAYDASGTGPHLLETIEGGCRFEDVGTPEDPMSTPPALEEFGLTTFRDYTGSTSGLPTAIDPPRLATTADQSTFTLTANDQLVATRTDPDPAAGGATTTFHYDVFNRRMASPTPMATPRRPNTTTSTAWKS